VLLLLVVAGLKRARAPLLLLLFIVKVRTNAFGLNLT
jgi:hypothetical protein